MKKLLPERKRPQPQIVLTNLIDVILMLVFFFMITSSFAKEKNRIPIELPAASSSGISQGEILSVVINNDGVAFVNSIELNVDALKQKVAEYIASNQGTDPQILVEADVSTDYGKVVSLLDEIRMAGGKNIGLSTKNKSEVR
ncbi:MAG: biopolymer transporter ExbD [Candidatus Riflebacteria bacterium]|nr:biopolymer transporter ExbD [Candidatus Riflebacteria bacterium]